MRGRGSFPARRDFRRDEFDDGRTLARQGTLGTGFEHEIVNRGRKSAWQFRCTYTHEGSRAAKNTHDRSDTLRKERLAD
jgi:hypothetical protein